MEHYLNIKIFLCRDYIEYIFGWHLMYQGNWIYYYIPCHHKLVITGEELNHFGVNNTHFDPLQELAHKDVDRLFRRTLLLELFEDIEIRKYIILIKISNHVPLIDRLIDG